MSSVIWFVVIWGGLGLWAYSMGEPTSIDKSEKLRRDRADAEVWRRMTDKERWDYSVAEDERKRKSSFWYAVGLG